MNYNVRDKYGNYGYQGIHRVRVAKTTTVYEIYDVSGPTKGSIDYEEAHKLALDKAQGSKTNAKLVGTTHIHETKVKGSFLYNRLSTEGDRLQKELGWDS